MKRKNASFVLILIVTMALILSGCLGDGGDGDDGENRGEGGYAITYPVSDLVLDDDELSG